MDNEIIVLLGKCCAGKDYTARDLVRNFGYNFVVSTTTRPMRDGESEGDPYYFITNAEFENKIANGGMIEYREYIRNNDKWYYGVTEGSIEDDKKYVAVLDIIGLRGFRKRFGDRVHATYIDVPDDVRLARCKRRGDFDENEWELRALDDAKKFTPEIIKEIGNTIYWCDID